MVEASSSSSSSSCIELVGFGGHNLPSWLLLGFCRGFFCGGHGPGADARNDVRVRACPLPKVGRHLLFPFGFRPPRGVVPRPRRCLDAPAEVAVPPVFAVRPKVQQQAHELPVPAPRRVHEGREPPVVGFVYARSALHDEPVGDLGPRQHHGEVEQRVALQHHPRLVVHGEVKRLLRALHHFAHRHYVVSFSEQQVTRFEHVVGPYLSLPLLPL
mmetsp:Transcript_79765/g.159272  ORF Transcript_79765/g.159272 Transcript_79765/m.159272 type:complete len:214 (+) Transcript_79765:113-754(+)